MRRWENNILRYEWMGLTQDHVNGRLGTSGVKPSGFITKEIVMVFILRRYFYLKVNNIPGQDFRSIKIDSVVHTVVATNVS
jgi:hypothetical protein